MLAALRELTPNQRNAATAGFLGWTLDAFDFFVLVFVLHDVAKDFHTQVESVTFAILLTLAMRPLGAFIFGVLADRYGRRPILMLDIVMYSVLELASAFAPNLTVFILLRALYGIAMGGEWGVGASLTMESIPAKARGLISGIFQEGYVVGYLLAAIVYYLLFPLIGWRGMFALGIIPAFLVLYIRTQVKESPAWRPRRHRSRSVFADMWTAIRGQWRLFIYVIALMSAFNFFSHGTQDVYPTFLQEQHHLSSHAVGIIAIIYNIGALAGGICFGALSERIGRRRAIVIAALLALPLIPLWALPESVVLLTVGAFLIQFMVQGAWGIIPVHLNELSPADVRATFPGFTYQLGNFFASITATLQVGLAQSFGGDYGLALAIVTAVVALVVAVLTGLGPEAKGHALATE